jgi:DNA-binding NtrC family response regulator
MKRYRTGADPAGDRLRRSPPVLPVSAATRSPRVPRPQGETVRHLEGIVGRSGAMRALFHRIARVAATQVPVLITGETGTGKELIAEAVHRMSGRPAFVPVNCSAIPASLLESELFGHVRGAFTGADRDRIGLFEAAHGGTLFLDEIAELPVALQGKLLRVLQSGEFRRVGETNVRTASVRLIAATHRVLEKAIQAGTFREDLFYRINVLRLDVPPLRARASDIPLLAHSFLAEFARRDQQPAKTLTPAALALLVRHPWPGNVRQLRNAVERMAVLSERTTLDGEDLPDIVRESRRDAPVDQRVMDLTLADVEREHILAVLRCVGGNRSHAAATLGMPRRTLYRRLEEYGILRRE